MTTCESDKGTADAAHITDLVFALAACVQNPLNSERQRRLKDRGPAYDEQLLGMQSRNIEVVLKMQ